MPTNDTKIERRSFEVRAAQGDEFAIVGRAASYGVESKNLGGFVEVIQPGAFDQSLGSGQNVMFCVNHDVNQLLARSDNGSLELRSDGDGLNFKAKLNRNIQAHQDAYEACRTGLLRECSFGFVVQPDGEKWNGKVRTLSNVRLFDVSLVAQPAYPGTAASARGAIPTTAQLKDRLAKIDATVFASEDEQRRQRLADLAKRMDGPDVEDPEDELDEKDSLLAELQQLADKRYGPRFRVIDADCTPDNMRCGTAIMRDMLSDAEDFYGVDYGEEDYAEGDHADDDAEDGQRSKRDRRSMMTLRKRLRFTSYRRKVSPHGTRWEKSQRNLEAGREWRQKLPDINLRNRMQSASR